VVEERAPASVSKPPWRRLWRWPGSPGFETGVAALLNQRRGGPVVEERAL